MCRSASRDGDQRQPNVTQRSEQSVERGLIDDWTGQQRVAIRFERDRHPLEPTGPLRTKMALDPDLIDHSSPFFTLVTLPTIATTPSVSLVPVHSLVVRRCCRADTKVWSGTCGQCCFLESLGVVTAVGGQHVGVDRNSATHRDWRPGGLREPARHRARSRRGAQAWAGGCPCWTLDPADVVRYLGALGARMWSRSARWTRCWTTGSVVAARFVRRCSRRD